MNRLPDLVRRSAELWPEEIALAPARGRQGGWSYAQLRNLQERGASCLRARQMTPGDRALLFLEPCAAWPAAFFATLEAGLVAVPLPPETPLPVALGIAAFAGVRAAILSDRTRALAQASDLQCLSVEQLFDAEPESATTSGGTLSDLALLAFTSGSTQQPRAVELTHANLLANLQALLEVRRAAPGDAFLSMLPPAHLFELLVGQLGPLACGARIVYAPALLPHRLLAAVRDEEITHALAVPALLEVLYEEIVSQLIEAGAINPERRDQTPAETALRLRQPEISAVDLEKLRAGIRERIGAKFHTLVVGGAALDPAWAEIAAAVGLRLEVGYGLTEASPIVSVALAAESPSGSAGRPLPGMEVRLGDNDEILVRGPNVMRGYYRDPEATAAALDGGWLHTGDRGRIDDQGFLFLSGRLKEALKTASGETLYPEEVEPYYASPLFAEWCVTGLPGPQGNDVPTLFVVPAAPPGDEHDLQRAFEDLRAAAPARVRVPHMVCLPGPLPRTALGKIRRRSLGQEWQKRGAVP
jgi:long-chain acyl-CoA synthetase